MEDDKPRSPQLLYCTDDELYKEVKRREELKYFVLCANRDCVRKIDSRKIEAFCNVCENLYNILENSK